MVGVKYVVAVFSLHIHASLSIPQSVPPTVIPVLVDSTPFPYQYDYGNYDASDYGKQYGDYVKQYIDYVHTYGDHGDYAYDDYGANEYAWDYGDDYTDGDDDHPVDYGEYFVFGDRNNPLDTVMHVYDDNGLQSEMPWVYIIVPVVQIDVYYADAEQQAIGDIEMQLPIETFFFEMGDFGMGHFDLSDFGLGGFQFPALTVDYPEYTADYTYDDYPVYGNYQGTKANLYASGEELADVAILDYPGIDHDPYWVDWIFMIPPEDQLIGPGPHAAH